MKTLLGLVLVSLFAVTAHADEDPLASATSFHERIAPAPLEPGLPGIEVVKSTSHAKVGVCFAPLGATIVVEPVNGVPAFRRMHEGLAADWTVDISAALSRSSWRGNAVFTFYDLGDASSIDEDRYVALYQAPIAKGKELFAHAHLSPAGGFQAGHTYRMRIAQLINGAEVVLTENDLRLE